MEYRDFTHYTTQYKQDHPDATEKKIWKSFQKRIIQRGGFQEEFKMYKEKYPYEYVNDQQAWRKFYNGKGGTPSDTLEGGPIDTLENVLDDVFDELSQEKEVKVEEARAKVVEDRGVPGEDRGVPGEDRGVPGEDRGVPGEDRGVPGDDRGVPGDDRGVPGEDRDFASYTTPDGAIEYLSIYPYRVPVPAPDRSWTSGCVYNPPIYTLLSPPFQITDLHEKCIVIPEQRSFETTYGERILIGSTSHDLPDSLLGKPLNPVGRTGLAGCGIFPQWGPNDYCYALFSQKQNGKWHVQLEPDTLNIQGVPIRNLDPIESLQCAFLCECRHNLGLLRNFHESIQDYELDIEAPHLFPHIAETILPKFIPFYRILESIVQQAFTMERGCIYSLYNGYLNDPRNTDNAWAEGGVYMIDLEHQPSSITEDWQWDIIRTVNNTTAWVDIASVLGDSSTSRSWLLDHVRQPLPDYIEGHIYRDESVGDQYETYNQDLLHHGGERYGSSAFSESWA